MSTNNDTKMKQIADPTLLAKARKARFDDLPNFSGHPSEDVERFLKSIKNITRPSDASNNSEILEIVRGKLVKSAGLWFDNNEALFERWSDFETAFRNRYCSTTMTYTKFDRLKQRNQMDNEPIAAYYDDVVNLCREIDPHMSEHMIIQYLISGLDQRFKKAVSRHGPHMETLNDFLTYAKIEQDLHETFDKDNHLQPETEKPLSPNNEEPIPSITAAIKPVNPIRKQLNENNDHSNYARYKSSEFHRNSTTRTGYQPSTTYRNQFHRQPTQITTSNYERDNWITAKRSFSQCRICGRNNHRTIDCLNKRPSGCFNCGQSHVVRECPFPPNFQ